MAWWMAACACVPGVCACRVCVCACRACVCACVRACVCVRARQCVYMCGCMGRCMRVSVCLARVWAWNMTQQLHRRRDRWSHDGACCDAAPEKGAESAVLQDVRLSICFVVLFNAPALETLRPRRCFPRVCVCLNVRIDVRTWARGVRVLQAIGEDGRTFDVHYSYKRTGGKGKKSTGIFRSLAEVHRHLNSLWLLAEEHLGRFDFSCCYDADGMITDFGRQRLPAARAKTGAHRVQGRRSALCLLPCVFWGTHELLARAVCMSWVACACALAAVLRFLASLCWPTVMMRKNCAN